MAISDDIEDDFDDEEYLIAEEDRPGLLKESLDEALEQESIDTTWDNIKVWLKQNKGLEITRN